MRLSCVYEDLVSCAQEALSFPSCDIFPLMAVKCVGVQKENILALNSEHKRNNICRVICVGKSRLVFELL